MRPLIRRHDFSSLSIEDLLEARDAYHVHLANLDNVVGTAIGKYLIRDNDPDARDPDKALTKPSGEKRTLTNTVIRPWSWPCVLVFVRDWAQPAAFAGSPDQYIPPYLYLPDGRTVPTCTVCAIKDPNARAPIYDLNFSDGLLGGGYPVLSTVQGEDRIGSLGCLVTDTHTVFALTNRHVAGPPGQVMFTVTEGQRRRIGVSHTQSLGKLDFADAYPGWPGMRAQLNLDAGLIRLDDLSEWTAQVYGIGEIDELADANVDTLSLDIIDKPVLAFAAASGALQGRIKALFYRYDSVGGFKQLADFMIGPRESDMTLPTRRGDSGTVWFWAPSEEQAKSGEDPNPGDAPKAETAHHHPLALQWGGETLAGDGGQEQAQFALASSLATICRAMDMELLTNWDTGHNAYWGKVGHYKIGAKACDVVANKKLFKLMQDNLDRIAVSDTQIEGNQLPKMSDAYIALADVSDLVWRSRRNKEGPAHFADMDETGAGPFANTTLLELWNSDTASRNPQTWSDFYNELGVHFTKQGYLPFRVREIYEEMVDAVRRGSLSRYVAAAGILAHYIGDACQPLHVSHLHHGRPGHPQEHKVHSVFETKMLDRFRVELLDLINERLDGLEIVSRFTGGAAAADAAVQLMHFTIETLPPVEVIEAYNAHEGRRRTEHMWEVTKDRAADCMAQGVLYLAEMWESAWFEGGGNRIANSRLRKQSKTTIKKLYLKKEWMSSGWLREKSFNNQ